MAQGSSKVATRAAASSVPFVPLIEKSPAVTGTAFIIMISKRIIRRIGANPFSIFTKFKYKSCPLGGLCHH
jgi:hypothetical protein